MTTERGIAYHAFDQEFADIVDLERSIDVLHTGTVWAEGPVFDPRNGALYFSDVPENVLYRWTRAGVEIARSPSEYSNGNTMDAHGALITCEHRTRSVTRTDRLGARTTLVDRFDGARLNSPNDVIVASDGSVWFTDPDYGIRSESQGGVAPRELDGCYVFRFSPEDGSLVIAADDLVMPNGLAFSPDESVLYVADSAYTEDPDAPRHVRAYDVGASGALTGSRVFVEIDEGWPDGLRVDAGGRLWVAAGDGARCYSPIGRHLGTILLPEIAANLCFMDVDGEPALAITASSSVYRVALRHH